MKSAAIHQFSYPNPRSSRRTFLVFAAGGAAALATGLHLGPAAAQSAYGEGETINSTTATFAGGTYAVTAEGTLYQYATGTDGYAYSNSYDGSSWSGWEQAGEQTVGYDPAPVAYDGKGQAYYTGGDDYIYEVKYDTYGDAQWENVSGDYTFQAAPYATTWEDSVYLYGTSADGYVYHKGYTDGSWSTWEPLNETDAPAKTDSRPYSVSWDDHENTFWLGDDGYVYWNRYNYADGAWTGAKQIPSDYTHKCVPYAVGYAPESSLYAYGVSTEGYPVYNVFDGSGWSGWEQIEAEWTSGYQPNAYVYNDAQHVVYVADGGNAYYKEYGADGWSDGWQDLGGNYAYDTYQYEYDDQLYLTYTGENGNIYYKEYAADGGGTLEPTATEDDGY